MHEHSAGFTRKACKACHRAAGSSEHMLPTKALHYGACNLLSLWGVRTQVSSRIRTTGCVEFKLLRSSLEKSGCVDVCNMKLISREFQFEQPLQPGMQSPVPSSTSGWDPYDVWSTRVRRDLLPVAELPRKRRVVTDAVKVTPEKPAPTKASKKERASGAVLPVVFVLLLLLALSCELLRH
jgi:hypothetical protein